MRVWEQKEREQSNLSSAITRGWTNLESSRLAGAGDTDVTVPTQLLPSLPSCHRQNFSCSPFGGCLCVTPLRARLDESRLHRGTGTSSCSKGLPETD